MQQKQDGFTLVELAISLMVIGLLIGGVLKGQELITNAQVVRIVKDADNYNTAITIFQSIYGDFPAEISNPSSVLPNCNTAPCNTAPVDMGRIGTLAKSIQFWFHLERAGLISNINTDVINSVYPSYAGYAAFAISPKNAFGGYVYLTYASINTDNASFPLKNRFAIATTPAKPADLDPNGNPLPYIPSYPISKRKYVEMVDRKADDGKPTTGYIQAGKEVRYEYGVGTRIGTSGCVEPANYLTYRMDVDFSCILFIDIAAMQ